MVLGMADVILRHGGGAHYMRPDRVYATSVLSPMMGYQPHRDVNAVTREFTQGPYLGLTLQGLGAPGPVRRWWEMLKARLAQRKAEKIMQVAAQMPAVAMTPTAPTSPAMSPVFVPPGHAMGMPGAAPAMATEISPHLAMQMAGVLALTRMDYGPGYPNKAAQTLVYRPLAQWYR